MAAFLSLVGFAISIGTATLTAVRYRDLPDSIPIHFGISGRADNYGPRPLIWLLVGVQSLVLLSYLVFGRFLEESVSTVAVRDFILAMLAWLQIQIISATRSGTNRISTLPVWCFLGALVLWSLFARHFLNNPVQLQQR